MIGTKVTVGHPAGIHARVAAHAVLLASGHSASVFLRSLRGTASLARLADLLRLDVREGDVVEVLADGPDEVETLHDIATFLTSTTDGPVPHTASDEGND
ncbi:HPr family phosphocarrier protein [Cutibacterium sp. WCA-380-WT-3A]|uniref:HPr family phosphocarrier protein n=1 Tax=Cutibacterium porci TaxID=2605781 RepID=A0A7K0J936_9ACTN|nr:HPr family phosphocarrier protein [Cutibacterium porci]MSS46484.1 HPr family phosphocarrier protein [Cutibacterium porci]